MNVINTYFIDVVKNHYFDFNGRATRTQFWMFMLFRIIVINILIMLLASFLGDTIGTVLTWVVILGLFFPDLGIQVRRLHDIGRSGWWLLIGFVPVIGLLVLLVFFLLPSKK